MKYTDKFAELVTLYGDTDIDLPHLKPITLAMWLLESGRGASGLAENHNNFAGMKWRSPMKPYGKRILYKAHDGSGYYTEFNSLVDFISGFWAFLERAPYDGWEDHSSSSTKFIEFVGPIWAEDSSYVSKVLSLEGEAESLLGLEIENSDPIILVLPAE